MMVLLSRVKLDHYSIDRPLTSSRIPAATNLFFNWQVHWERLSYLTACLSSLPSFFEEEKRGRVLLIKSFPIQAQPPTHSPDAPPEVKGCVWRERVGTVVACEGSPVELFGPKGHRKKGDKVTGHEAERTLLMKRSRNARQIPKT